MKAHMFVVPLSLAFLSAPVLAQFPAGGSGQGRQMASSHNADFSQAAAELQQANRLLGVALPDRGAHRFHAIVLVHIATEYLQLEHAGTRRGRGGPGPNGQSFGFGGGGIGQWGGGLNGGPAFGGPPPQTGGPNPFSTPRTNVQGTDDSARGHALGFGYADSPGEMAPPPQEPDQPGAPGPDGALSQMAPPPFIGGVTPRGGQNQGFPGVPGQNGWRGGRALRPTPVQIEANRLVLEGVIDLLRDVRARVGHTGAFGGGAALALTQAIGEVRAAENVRQNP